MIWFAFMLATADAAPAQVPVDPVRVIEIWPTPAPAKTNDPDQATVAQAMELARRINRSCR